MQNLQPKQLRAALHSKRSHRKIRLIISILSEKTVTDGILIPSHLKRYISLIHSKMSRQKKST